MQAGDCVCADGGGADTAAALLLPTWLICVLGLLMLGTGIALLILWIKRAAEKKKRGFPFSGKPRFSNAYSFLNITLRSTLPERRQRVQTYMVLGAPSTITRTF